MAERNRPDHRECANCGTGFATPLAWSARCPACGRLLYASSREARRQQRDGSGRSGGGFGRALRVAAMLGLLAVGLSLLPVERKPPPPTATAAVAAAAPAPAALGERVAAADRLRQREIDSCSEDEAATTIAHHGRASQAVPFDTLYFLYNPALAPEQLSQQQVEAMLARAAGAWAACGVRTQYAGTTAETDGSANALIFQWYNSEGNPVAGFRKGSTVNLNIGSYQQWNAQSPALALDALQLVISHEMGHALGLVEHSARCIDVMATYDSFDKCEMPPAANRLLVSGDRVFELKAHNLPTACDIRRCRMVNGKLAAAPSGSP